jgi:hypothetical protein
VVVDFLKFVMNRLIVRCSQFGKKKSKAGQDPKF